MISSTFDGNGLWLHNEGIVKQPLLLDCFFHFVGHMLFPSGFALFYHRQHIIRNDMKVFYIGVIDVLQLIIVNQITEEVFQIMRQLLLKIFKRKKRIVFAQCRIDIKLDIGSEKRGEALEDTSPYFFICLFFEDFLERKDAHGDSDLLSLCDARQVIDHCRDVFLGQARSSTDHAIHNFLPLCLGAGSVRHQVKAMAAATGALNNFLRLRIGSCGRSRARCVSTET